MKLLKHTLFFGSLISCSALFGQYEENDSMIKYVKIAERTSHRYPDQNFINKNVRLIQQKEKILLQTLNDSNALVSTTECMVVVFSETNEIALADSLPVTQVNEQVLGQDKTLPGTIIVYSLFLQKDGKHYQYYSNGAIEWKGKYKRGLKEGKWVLYEPNGKIKKIERYKEGKQVN